MDTGTHRLSAGYGLLAGSRIRGACRAIPRREGRGVKIGVRIGVALDVLSLPFSRHAPVSIKACTQARSL